VAEKWGAEILFAGESINKLGESAGQKALCAPDALLHVERRDGHRFVVDFGGVLIERGGGLGTEVAVAGVKVQCGNTVVAMSAGELHASGDAFGGVVSHCNDCSGRSAGSESTAVEGRR
jgi:hypothetical protein